MAERLASLISPGESWILSVGGVNRHARVISLGAAPGWWQCVDEETGMSFAASERWFLERLPDDDDHPARS